jgi:hypothetical protein
LEEQTKHKNTQMSSEKAPANKAMRALIIVSILLGIVLIGAPYGIQYGLVKLLKEAGSQQVELADVDFNPFSGELKIKELSASTKTKPELKVGLLSVAFEWLPLFKKQLVVNAIQLKDSSLDIHQLADKTLKVAGLKLPAKASNESKQKSEWGIGLGRVHLINNHFNIKTPTFETAVKIDDLALAQLISWKQGESSDVAFDAFINGAHITADFELDAFAKTPSVKGQLKLVKLQLAHFQPIVEETVNELNGLLSTDISFDVALSEQGVKYKQSGTVRLVESNISTKNIQLKQSDILWTGDITAAKKQDDLQLLVTGDIEMNGVDVNNTVNNVKILQLDQASFKGVNVSQLENINIANLVLDGLLLAQKNSETPALATAKNLTVSNVQLNDINNVAIDTVRLGGLVANINVDKKGQIAVLNQLLEQADTAPKSDEATKKIDTEKPSEDISKEPTFRIGSIETVGEGKIDIAYATVDKAVKKKILVKKFNLGELNTEKPEKLTPLKLEATINKHSKLFAEGAIAPFSKSVNANTKATLKAFELPEFSPLIREELGYDIQSGQLNADIDVKIKNNILDGKTKLDIHGLVMQPADEEKMAKMTQQLSMPLDSALSLLRDDKDDISLKIPVKGDLAKPDFDIGDVINTALGNALQGTVKNVLTYALQPYGLIFMLADKAIDAANSISLEAIEFTAGQSALPDKTAPYLERIGGLMKKRPGLRIRLCGVATPSDRLALAEQKPAREQADEKQTGDEKTKPSDVKAPLEVTDEQLQDLANARAEAVKLKLVADYKIDVERLFSCLPKIAKEEQKPRVEMLI